MRALILVALAGCTVSLTVSAELYARPRAVRVDRPPPALRDADDHGERPSATAVWVSGHWRWDGGWVWEPGKWQEPRPGHVWEPPLATARDGVYEYYPGYFRPEEEEPPDAYRTPDQIQLHVPADIDNNPALPSRTPVLPGGAAPRDTPALTRPEPDLGTDPTEPRPNPSTEDPGTEDPGTEDPGTEDPEARPDPEAQNGLSCELPIVRVPRSPGHFAIRGTGFTRSDLFVLVGGTTQTIRTNRGGEIQATTDRGGLVVVQRGDERAECGRLTLF